MSIRLSENHCFLSLLVLALPFMLTLGPSGCRLPWLHYRSR